jgi:hypothetical protein
MMVEQVLGKTGLPGLCRSKVTPLISGNLEEHLMVRMRYAAIRAGRFVSSCNGLPIHCSSQVVMLLVLKRSSVRNLEPTFLPSMHYTTTIEEQQAMDG